MKQLQLSSPDANLRLLQVLDHKIYKVVTIYVESKSHYGN